MVRGAFPKGRLCNQIWMNNREKSTQPLTPPPLVKILQWGGYPFTDRFRKYVLFLTPSLNQYSGPICTALWDFQIILLLFPVSMEW